MKCEKCNENEATVFYRASVNGETTQQNLCAHCAGELGLDKAFVWPGTELLEEAFGGFFGRDPFESFFSGSLLPRFGRTALLSRPAVKSEPAAKPDPELAARREKNALRAQLEAAVKAEDFEQAILLRDKLRELDK